MKRRNLLRPWVLAFFSRDLYDDVARKWKGLAFLYLLMLLGATWLISIVQFHSGYTDFVENEGGRIIDQIPQVTIDDGIVSVSEAQPYFIKSDNGDHLAIFDTTGEITSLIDEPSAYVLLTQDKLIWKKAPQSEESRDLSEIKHFQFDRDTVQSKVSQIGKLIIPVGYTLCLLFSFVYRIIQVLIYGAIGMVIASMTQKSIGYAAAIRLAVMAITPVIILNTVLQLLHLSLGYTGPFAYLAIAIGYLIFGVSSVRQSDPIRPSDDDLLGPESPISPYRGL